MPVNGILNSSLVAEPKGISPALPYSPALSVKSKEQNTLNDEAIWEHGLNENPAQEAGVYNFEKETYKGDKIPEEKEEGKETEGQKVSETGLTEEEREEIERLRKRDRTVRAHENAHRAAAGRYARGIHYEYERGPDGKMYAVGGSTQIDTSIPSDPAQAYQKAKTLEAAATAPGSNLSDSDRRLAAAARGMAAQAAKEMAQERKIAAQASQMAMEARAELMEERLEGSDEEKEAECPFGIEGLIQGERAKVTPEIERDIARKKQENPEIDEQDIKRWLKQTKGVDVSEEEIKRILRNSSAKTLSAIFNQQDHALGSMLDAVA